MTQRMIKSAKLMWVAVSLLLLIFAAFLTGWMRNSLLILAIVTGGYAVYIILAGPVQPRPVTVMDGTQALELAEDYEASAPEQETDEIQAGLEDFFFEAPPEELA